MKPIFEPDQTVYLPDGREAVYVTQHNDKHLVRLVWESEDGEECYQHTEDKLTPVQDVYAAPPVAVWDRYVVAKRDLSRQLDREIGLKRRELNALTAQAAGFIELIDAYKERIAGLEAEG